MKSIKKRPKNGLIVRSELYKTGTADLEEL